MSSLAMGTAACSPEDGARDESTHVDDAAAPHHDTGTGTLDANFSVTPETGPSGARDGGPDLTQDATTPDQQRSDAAQQDAMRGPSAEDASATDAAAEAGVADASSGATATPSAGCGKSGRPGNGRVSVAGKHNYLFPASYDGRQPLPLLLGFHAASNPIDQIENLTKGSAFETGFVRAFPKSKGSAWDYAADLPNILAMLDDLKANYCIDTSRVFATGHSSGAQLIMQILTPARKADADRFRFKAIAPVAASRYGTVSRPIPALYIQGSRDSERNSDGADVVKELVTANGCANTSQAYAGPVCSSGGKPVHDGCVRYDGCKVPTVWCSHDDPAYANTNHGWPCFATKAMHDFFASLP